MTVTDTATADYRLLFELVRNRTSVRSLKPDPVPDEYIEMILEVGRWSMSGANSQPWEFVVVKDPEVKRELFRVYSEINGDFVYWMEQQRIPELRHPSYQMTHDEAVMRSRTQKGWSEAPFLIVVLGDGRRQWGTIQAAHTYGIDQAHLTDGLASASMLMHLAGAALGLGSQHTTIHLEQPFKQVLGVPEPLRLVLIMPFGYPDVPSIPGSRRPLADMVHHDHYDMAKYMSNEDVIKYLHELRGKTIPIYRNSYTGETDGQRDSDASAEPT